MYLRYFHSCTARDECSPKTDRFPGFHQKITGPLRHTHAHTCTTTQIYDLKSGYVGGPGLLIPYVRYFTTRYSNTCTGIRIVRYHRSIGSRTSDLSISDNRVKPLSQAPAGSSHARQILQYIIIYAILNSQMICRRGRGDHGAPARTPATAGWAC